MRLVALRQSLIGGATAGKWDRFATFGEKVHDGSAFEFSPETVGQMLENFARFNRGRRLGMDHEHQAIMAAQNGKPAPNLAYYNGMAVIVGGQLTAFHAQQPDVPKPDPVRLLMELREKYPEETSVDGGWIYRCEVTPLGQELLPNYEQISPLVNMEADDEQGNPIGARLLNVSAVNVAFQDRTIINLSALAQNDSSLHSPGPVQRRKGAAMADEKDPKDGEGKNALRSECMKMLGLGEEDSDDAMYGALKTRLAMADDMSKGAEEEEKKVDKDADGMGALAAPEMPAAMSALTSRVNEEARARAAMQAELETYRAERQARKASEWKAFSAQYLDEAGAAKYLEAHKGDIDGATLALSALNLPKRGGVYETFTAGGRPIGAPDVQPDGEFVTPSGNPTIGLSIAKQARDLAEKKNIPLRDAYLQVGPKKRSPSYF